MNQIYEQNAPWELIGRKLSGNISPEESQNLETWIKEDQAHAKIMEQSEFVWAKSQELDHSFEKDIQLDLAWSKLSNQLGFEEKETKVIKASFWQRYRSGAVAAAAVLFIGILGYYWIFPSLNGVKEEQLTWLTIENELNEPKTVQMPDGSTIVLNKNTILEYPDKFGQRLVKLKGEAYFDVEHNPEKPFVVEFGQNGEKVEVLGTRFNIRAYDQQNEIEVAVQTGKVRFETATKKQLLESGQAASYQKAEDQMTLAQRPNATSWKSGSFEFDNQKLGSIISDLKHHYNKDIQLKNQALRDCVFSAKPEKEKLENILQAIAFGLELELEEKDGVYYLNGLACELE